MAQPDINKIAAHYAEILKELSPDKKVVN